MSLRLVTPNELYPAVEWTEVAAHLRLDEDGGQEQDVDHLVAAASGYVENATGRQLMATTWAYTCASIPCDGIIKLPRSPLREVESIVYFDSAGDQQTLSEDSYVVGTNVEPGFVLITDIPLTFKRPDAITITFIAGYAIDYTADIPEPLRLAIKLLAADWYRNREASAAGSRDEIPIGVTRIIEQYRIAECL